MSETVITPTTEDPAPRPRLSELPMGRIYMGEDPPDHSSAPAPPAADPATPTPSDPVLPDTPEAQDAASQATEPPVGDPDTPADPPKFRHKSWEDAEKSYSHAQAKITHISQENARLKKELEERERAEADTRAQEAAAAREKQVADRYEKAMAALQELDEYDPDYKAKAAKVWAECHRDVATVSAASIADQTVTPTVSPSGEASAPVDDPSGGIVPPEGPSEGEPVDPAEIRSRISSRMKDQQVAPTEFDLDDPVFFGFASKAPTHDDSGAPLPFEAQVDWAIAQTRSHYQRTKQRILQTTGQPLGRGSTGSARPAGEPPPEARRVTLNSSVENALNRRKL